MSPAALRKHSQPIQIEAVRDGVVESVHLLDVAVVDGVGTLIGGWGDTSRISYFRSAFKPIQAAVSMQIGWVPSASEQVAVACASHSAEAPHLDVVASILGDAGLGEEALRCPPALPLDPLVAARVGTPQPRYRDCSGKHAAFLAAAVAAGHDIQTYLNPKHPVQQAMIDAARRLAKDVVAVGVDGCGALTPAAPLHRLAFAFGAGITPGVHAAMRAHPFLVAGSRRVDTDIMEAVEGDLVCKSGAEGLMCFWAPSVGLAGAIKVRDGSARAVAPACIWVLEACGLLETRHVDALAAHAAPPVLGGGESHGCLRVFAGE